MNDMDRESLCAGIIVTAAGLSPDAKQELKRHNGKGLVYLAHFSLEDILAGNIQLDNMRFMDGDLSKTIRKHIERFLLMRPEQS